MEWGRSLRRHRAPPATAAPIPSPPAAPSPVPRPPPGAQQAGGSPGAAGRGGEGARGAPESPSYALAARAGLPQTRRRAGGRRQRRRHERRPGRPRPGGRRRRRRHALALPQRLPRQQPRQHAAPVQNELAQPHAAAEPGGHGVGRCAARGCGSPQVAAARNRLRRHISLAPAPFPPAFPQAPSAAWCSCPCWGGARRGACTRAAPTTARRCRWRRARRRPAAPRSRPGPWWCAR